MTQRAPRTATIGGEWLRGIDAALEAAQATEWPSTRYSVDPVGYAFNVLGVETWGKQDAILESVRDNRHTTVSGGRKVGKDFVGAIAAWWWFCSFHEARTMCFGPTMRQIDEILYLEIRKLHSGHGRCVKCKRDNPNGPRPCPHSAIIPEKPSLRAEGGVHSKDHREIIGLASAGEGGSIGFSGRILAIEDEAAHMKDAVDDAIVGNLAGADTRRLLIANPVKTRGFFFRSHHSERSIYKTFEIASTESPNIVQRRNVYPGLASIEWLEERSRAWGEKSAMWQWHVLGKFLKSEAGQLFSLEDVGIFEERHATAPAEGRLYLGIDVAGESESGDEIAFAPRRGLKSWEIESEPGLTPEGILVRALSILARRRRPEDVGEMIPVVVLDKDGAEGAKVFNVFSAWRWQHPEAFKLVGFRGGERPKGVNGQAYKINRDLLYGCLFAWLNPPRGDDEHTEGGAIVPNLMLEAQLVEMRGVGGDELQRNVLIHKSILRKILKRSPDHADALALSCWGDVQAIAKPMAVADDIPDEASITRELAKASREEQGYAFHEPEDPAEALNAFRGDGDFLNPSNRSRRSYEDED